MRNNNIFPQQQVVEQNFSQNLYLANAHNSTTNAQGLIFQNKNQNKSTNALPSRQGQNYVLSQNLAQSRLTQQQQQFQQEEQPQQKEDIEYLNQIFSQQCIYHPEMAITNFCKKSLMPLCPKCITNYLKSRESNNLPVEIENIEKIQTECKEAVLELEELYAMDIRKLREAKEQKSNLQENLAEKIIFQKNKVLKLVDSFFEGLEKDLSKQLSLKRTNYDKELNMAEGFALQKHQELHAIRMKLDGKKYLKYILRLLSENFFEESTHYHSECEQFMQLLTKKDVEIFNDDSKLYNLNIELAKFVSIKNSEILVPQDLEGVNFNFDNKNPYAATNYNQPNTTLYAEPQQQNLQQPLPPTNQQYENIIQKSTKNLMQQPNPKQEPQIIQSPIKGIIQPVQGNNNQQIVASKNLARSQQPQLFNENMPPVSQSQQQQPIKSVAVPSKPSNSQLFGTFSKQDFPATQQSSAAQSNARLVVNKNYFEQFCPSKVIHYFQPGTNQFYFIDLNTIGSDAQIPNLKWQYIELDISFKIPNDHSTIVTPQGEIYLCGGIDTSNMQVWADCFKLDLKFRTLERKPNMNIPRFLHGLVFLNNALYALGGFDQQHTLLDKCERLNLSENKWVRTSSMIGQSAQMGVCVYKNRYIIAFGVATHPKINLIQYYDPLFDVWSEVMLTLESGLLYSELLVRPQCGVSQINDNGTLLLFGGDETSQNNDQSRYQSQMSSQQRVPNNYLFTLKSENETLHFTVGLPKNPVDLYDTQIQGLAYAHNGRLYSALGQKQDQKIIAFSNGQWIKQI